jgi:hypothetical protein
MEEGGPLEARLGTPAADREIVLDARELRLGFGEGAALDAHARGEQEPEVAALRLLLQQRREQRFGRRVVGVEDRVADGGRRVVERVVGARERLCGVEEEGGGDERGDEEGGTLHGRLQTGRIGRRRCAVGGRAKGRLRPGTARRVRRSRQERYRW